MKPSHILKNLEVEQVGEINIVKMFLARLMHIIRLTEVLSTMPLPYNDPPLIPSTIPNSANAALDNAISDILKKADGYEEAKQEEAPALITYYQVNNDHIPQFPNQPHQYYDPRSIPIGSRPYHQGGANDYIRQAAGVHANLLIDLRSLTIVENGEHVPMTFLCHFTELAGSLAPYIFPGRLAPTHEWSLDVICTNAMNFLERIIELHQARQEVEQIYQDTSHALTKNQLAEVLSPHITLHKHISPNSNQLTPINMDRIYLWQRIHPV